MDVIISVLLLLLFSLARVAMGKEARLPGCGPIVPSFQRVWSLRSESSSSIGDSCSIEIGSSSSCSSSSDSDEDHPFAVLDYGVVPGESPGMEVQGIEEDESLARYIVREQMRPRPFRRNGMFAQAMRRILIWVVLNNNCFLLLFMGIAMGATIEPHFSSLRFL